MIPTVFWRDGVFDVCMNVILQPGMAKSDKGSKMFTMKDRDTLYRLKVSRLRWEVFRI